MQVTEGDGDVVLALQRRLPRRARRVAAASATAPPTGGRGVRRGPALLFVNFDADDDWLAA